MDENGFNADSLQQFCYNLCYLFSRCTRSVSIVPPAYYAHLLAYRARFHAVHDLWGSDTASERSGGAGGNREVCCCKLMFLVLMMMQYDEKDLQSGLAPIHAQLLSMRPMFFV